MRNWAESGRARHSAMELGAIFPAEIDRVRDRIRIGSWLMCQTWKYPRQDVVVESRSGVRVCGEVVAKYRYHAVLRYRNGVTESVTWAEIAIMMREKARRRRL